MKKTIKHILILLSIIIYALSVLEVNAFGIENTFFDEYDTYVEGKEQNVETLIIEKKKKDDEKTDKQFFQNYFNATIQQNFQPFLFISDNRNFATVIKPNSYRLRKLFVLHSVWII